MKNMNIYVLFVRDVAAFEMRPTKTKTSKPLFNHDKGDTVGCYQRS